MVHSIIRGLPTTGSWPHFAMLVTQNTQDFIDSQSHVTVPAAPDTLLTCIINCLVVECQRIDSSKPTGKSGPGSEYCNHAGPPGMIHKHEKNPNGILCSNCGKKSHDWDQCFAKGGGMEGQGPKSKEKTKGKPELVAVASSSATSSTSVSPPVPDAYVRDLSCALAEILSANGGFAHIGTPHCTERFDSRNGHTVSNNSDSMNT
jgi:hypothetical protein